MNAGQRAYAERVEDIQALHVDIAALRSELAVLKASVQNIDLLRHEALQLNREVLHERTKVRALSEELDQQMNVHRWRKLEGSDPATYSMIQRAHALQKTLIRKTEEVASKDQLIQEKEKLYVELKNILARQPGPEVAEQLSVYQTNLREKTKQMKAMAAELNMYHSQVRPGAVRLGCVRVHSPELAAYLCLLNTCSKPTPRRLETLLYAFEAPLPRTQQAIHCMRAWSCSPFPSLFVCIRPDSRSTTTRTTWTACCATCSR